MITAADKRRFREQGYLVLEALVPETLCAAAKEAISLFVHVEPDDPDTWQAPGIQGHGIVPLHHAQAFWDIRQHPAVHAAFAGLYETEKLWVSIDRASFKAPSAVFDEPYRVDPIHWDGDPRRQTQLSLQGLVYLTDTSPEQGGFCCVPDLYRDLPGYLARQDPEAPLLRPMVDSYRIERVGAPAGSLVLWDRRLPHSSGENRAEAPRWVVYVAMAPEGDASARQALSTLYREKRVPQWAVRQQVPGQQIPEPGAPAQLTELGRKLVGLRSW